MYITTTVKGGKAQILHIAATNQPARAVTTLTDATVAGEVAHRLTSIETGAEHGPEVFGPVLATLASAVAAALRCELERYAPGTERTWTFFGHWEGSTIVVEYTVPGIADDLRVDTGTWPEGLWCDSGSGRTEAEAQARTVAEYETDAIGECSVCRGSRQAPPPGETNGPKQSCWFCVEQPV